MFYEFICYSATNPNPEIKINFPIYWKIIEFTYYYNSEIGINILAQLEKLYEFTYYLVAIKSVSQVFVSFSRRIRHFLLR